MQLPSTNLGVCYASGRGVVRDEVEAVKWFRKAADQNHARAQVALGGCYSKGEGVVKDELEAVLWWCKAADQNHAQAQFNLGVCYQEGQGVVMDEVEAVEWYRKAAMQDFVSAQFNLGNCYYFGQGVAEDKAEAVKWFRKPAEQNATQAQLLLGLCYQNGQGVARDDMEAVKWFRKAAEGGDGRAFNALAWLLATSQNRLVRNGSNAVVFAEKAVAVTKRSSPAELDTLAAAYAQARQFDKAVSTEREAIALLQTEAERTDYESRLKLFERHLPYRAKN